MNKLHEFLFGTLPRMLPAVCLAAFLVFEESWICILVAAACMAYIYLVQVFVEKKSPLSTYLFVVIGLLVLVWLEYQYRFLAGLLS